jgi:hypothetical protein
VSPLLVDWSYIIVCNQCGYVSSEKLAEKEAEDLKLAHIKASKDCSTNAVSLMKART